MSASTDRIYREWLARNNGGMGAMATMETRRNVFHPAGRETHPLPSPVPPSRHEKQALGAQIGNLVTKPVDMSDPAVHSLVVVGKNFQ